MIPNAADITRGRMIASAAVRLFGALLLLAFANTFLWMLESIIGSSPAMYGAKPRDIVVNAVLFVLLASLVIAPGVWARLLVPFRRATGCPECKYPLEDLRAPACPECGLELTEEFMPGAVRGRVAPGSELAFRVRLRAVMVPVSSLFGLYLIIGYGFDAVADIFGAFFGGETTWEWFPTRSLVLGASALGVFMLVKAGAFAHWLVFGFARSPAGPDSTDGNGAT